jgi:hypothetical protein
MIHNLHIHDLLCPSKDNVLINTLREKEEKKEDVLFLSSPHHFLVEFLDVSQKPHDRRLL